MSFLLAKLKRLLSALRQCLFSKLTNPYRVVAVTFLATLMVGTFLLMLPVARSGAPDWPNGSQVDTFGPTLGSGAPFSVALFTATSSSCVTGLIVVDTATYWSSFGQFVLLLLMIIGGLGTMTLVSFIAVTLGRKLSLRQRMITSTAVSTTDLHNLGELLRRIVVSSAIIQGIGALLLFGYFFLSRGFSLTRSLWFGVFHAASAYNNAGFALFTDSLVSFNRDFFGLMPIALLIILGGLGFPVYMEIWRDRRIWTINSRLMLIGTACLIVFGTLFIATVEWHNPRTLGAMSVGDRWLNAFFSAVTPRTAGFNSIDLSAVHNTTWLGTDILMAIGGGPASTAGGIKVTTVCVVFMIIVSQVQGRDKVFIGRHRLDQQVPGEVITVIGLSMFLIIASTMVFMLVTPYPLDRCLFEVISAFATTGLTTGITQDLPGIAQVILVVLMMIGRLGPVTVATSLALRARPLYYDYPVDRPLIG